MIHKLAPFADGPYPVINVYCKAKNLVIKRINHTFEEEDRNDVMIETQSMKLT